MSIIETVAVFVGIPAAVIVVVTGLVYSGGAKRARRYRPGRPFEFTPVWFLSAPELLSGAAPDSGDGKVGTGDRAVSGANRLALSKAEASVDAQPGGEVERTAAGPVTTAPQEATGGASDRW